MEEISEITSLFNILYSSLGRGKSRSGREAIQELDPPALLDDILPEGTRVPSAILDKWVGCLSSREEGLKLLRKVFKALDFKAKALTVFNIIDKFERAVVIEERITVKETFSTKVSDNGRITVNLARNFLERCSLPAFTHILEMEDEDMLKIEKGPDLTYEISAQSDNLTKSSNDFFAGWFQWYRKAHRVNLCDSSAGPSIHYMRGQRDAAQRFCVSLLAKKGWHLDNLNQRKLYFHDSRNKPVKYLDEYVGYILTDTKARVRLEKFLQCLIDRAVSLIPDDNLISVIKAQGADALLPETNNVISSLKPTKTVTVKGKKGKVSKETKPLPLVKPSELVVVRPVEKHLVQLMYDGLWDRCAETERALNDPNGWKSTLLYDDFLVAKNNVKTVIDAERELIINFRKATQSRMKLVPLKDKLIDFKALKAYFGNENVNKIEFKNAHIDVSQVLNVKAPKALQILYGFQSTPREQIRADALLNKRGLPDQVFRLLIEGLGPQPGA